LRAENNYQIKMTKYGSGRSQQENVKVYHKHAVKDLSR
jgi:hypothetical protein